MTTACACAVTADRLVQYSFAEQWTGEHAHAQLSWFCPAVQIGRSVCLLAATRLAWVKHGMEQVASGEPQHIVILIADVHALLMRHFRHAHLFPT